MDVGKSISRLHWLGFSRGTTLRYRSRCGPTPSGRNHLQPPMGDRSHMNRRTVVCPNCELKFTSARDKTYCPGCHQLVEPTLVKA